MGKQVAIVSYPEDLHCKYVSDRLRFHGASPVLLNLGEFPKGLQIGINLGITQSPRIVFSLENTSLDGDEIHGVWWRRPLGAYRDEEESLQKRYIFGESEALLRSLPVYMPNARWVSDPEATRAAGRKPVQLQIAQGLGLRVPKSALGNSVTAIEEFLVTLGDSPVIIKALNSGFVRLNPRAKDDERMNRVVYTQKITPEFFAEKKRHIPACPFILQEAIQKDMDVRVTIVGDTVFSMGIIAENAGDGREVIDWRRMDVNRSYIAHELPKEIAHQCVEITKRLGLCFGCIDLGYSEKEGYSFFEINPQGQWLVSEEVLGFPIADTLVGMLMR